jgi:predicted transcriptional regulator of viral defense system
LVEVWRAQNQVKVSDPSRTIVDLLDDPPLGGGMRHVADVLRSYFEGTSRDDDLLADYAGKIGNRAVFKRLGYLLETLGIASPKLTKLCADRMSAGINLLDPSAKPSGPILKRWGLRVNVKLATDAR